MGIIPKDTYGEGNPERDYVSMGILITYHPHVKMMKECIYSVRKGMPQFLFFLATGDLYPSTRNGIPGAYFGPGDPKFQHQVNERIRVDDLIEAAKIYGLMILRFCS